MHIIFRCRFIIHKILLFSPLDLGLGETSGDGFGVSAEAVDTGRGFGGTRGGFSLAGTAGLPFPKLPLLDTSSPFSSGLSPFPATKLTQQTYY